MNALTSHAFWIDSPGAGSLRAEVCSKPRANEVLIRTLYSGISRGTEALIWNGQVPQSEYQRMRAPFQAGEFPSPVKYGYASVGVVEAGPAEWLGASVFCLYPHQDCYVVPTSAVHRLPENLPPERAILAANVETAINATWDLAPAIGEQIAVIGGGVVGLLVASLLQALPGTAVQLIDVNPAREAIAAKLGLEFALPGNSWESADRVVHTSASEAGLAQALRMAANQGVVLELSWYGSHPVSAPLGADFHAKRITLRSSQVGQLPLHMAAQWDTSRRLALALDLLTQNPHWDALIDQQTAFTDLPQQMPGILAAQGLCHRITYSEKI